MTSDLKEAREKAGYTIEEVANKLNIRKQYLINLEEGNYEEMPGKVYIEGYIKMYHEFLGLSLPKKRVKEITSPSLPTTRYEVSGKYRKIIIIVTVSLLLIVLFTYNTIMQKSVIKVGTVIESGEYPELSEIITIDELITDGNNQASFNRAD